MPKPSSAAGLMDSLFEELPPILPKPKPEKKPEPEPEPETPEQTARRERIESLLSKMETPPECILLKAFYPERSGRIPVTVYRTAEETKRKRNGGAFMGFLYPSGTFLKIIQEPHLLRNPPSIAYDQESLRIIRDKILAFSVFVSDKRIWYIVSADVFFDKAMLLSNRGSSGNQLALPLTYWTSKQF
jgi:hypothetical protein